MLWISQIDDEDFGHGVEDASSFTEKDWEGVNRLLAEGWDIRQHTSRAEAEAYLSANAHGSRV